MHLKQVDNLSSVAVFSFHNCVRACKRRRCNTDYGSGDKTVPPSVCACSNCPVSLSRWKGLKQSVAGMSWILDNVASLLIKAARIDAVQVRELGSHNSLCTLNYPCKISLVLYSAAGIPHSNTMAENAFYYTPVTADGTLAFLSFLSKKSLCWAFTKQWESTVNVRSFVIYRPRNLLLTFSTSLHVCGGGEESFFWFSCNLQWFP